MANYMEIFWNLLFDSEEQQQFDEDPDGYLAAKGIPPDTSPDQMPGLIAYLQLVEGIPDWPFRPSTAVQLVLYLLIPVASWLGSELIEGLLDAGVDVSHIGQCGTEEIYFATSAFDMDGGIVVTASHNPPEYNGYKVYWTDGGQIVPPEDGEIIAEINSLSFEDIKFDI